MAIVTVTKPYARDIAAYNDEDLDRYLEGNGRFVSDSEELSDALRCADVDPRTVSVQDPENISLNFIHRLRSRSILPAHCF